MSTLNKLFGTWKRFQKEEDGNVAMIFGSIFVILVATMGAGFDLTQLSSTNQKAGSIADTSALTAAIYYSTHGEYPQSDSDGFVDGVEYDAANMGYAFNGLSTKSARDVKIKVTYDTVNKEATARVYGHTIPAFMQVFGYNQLGFKAEAVAKFSEVQIKDPATIMFVLDNSGSMEFDDLPYGTSRTPLHGKPAGTKKRMKGLSDATKNLMGKLRAILKDAGSNHNGRDQRILRTALIPYSSNVLTNIDVPGQWGLLSNNQINKMRFRTGTNSAPPLDDALEVMKGYDSSDSDNEAKIHIDEHGEDPLRYVIFMTDGQNNGNFDIWDPRAGTETWRRWGKYVNCSSGGNGRYYRDDENGPHTCWAHNHQDWDWVYTNDSPSEPTDYSSDGWEEGIFDNRSNLDSRSTCAELHAEGVEVFTVSFGLQPGWFYTNNWGAGSYPDQFEIDQEVVDRATDLMKYCASSPQNYTDAIDSAALDAAFDKIGNNIIKELIRLAS